MALGLGLAACQKGLAVRFTSAAVRIHELLEARDERRLLPLHKKQLAAYRLPIIDELGYVPLSPTGCRPPGRSFCSRCSVNLTSAAR
jgi:DNA replication protein DnaC